MCEVCGYRAPVGPFTGWRFPHHTRPRLVADLELELGESLLQAGERFVDWCRAVAAAWRRPWWS